MATALFNDFSSIGKADWQAQAIKDLKGKDLGKTLNWQTPEDFEIESYYTIDDLNHEKVTTVQAAQKQQAGWANECIVKYENEKITNTHIISVLQKGADSVLIDLSAIDCSQVHFLKLLHNIKLSETAVTFKTNNEADVVIAELSKFINYKLKGGLADDGLTHFMATGYLSENYFETCADVIRKTQDSPQFKTICVDGTIFQNAGANAVQELAFTLASALTYLDKLTDLGLSANEVLAKMYFSVSVGTNYFMEIAKLRALRYLWSLVEKKMCDVRCAMSHIKLDSHTSHIIHHTSVMATTSPFYDAAITPYTNLIRATTEAMSAVMGGCDVLIVRPFDDVYQPSSEFSERVARNLSVILSEEAHLDKTADPSAGSYYIEKLTIELAETAWDLFLKVESLGGLIPAFEQNFIQNEIEANYHHITSPSNHQTQVGVNKYRFDEELFVKPMAKSVQIQFDLPFKILTNRRLSENFEI